MNEQIETPNFNEMQIGKLREYASHLKLPLAKTATKPEIIKAITDKLAGRAAVHMGAGQDDSGKLKPGYSRIKVLEDPTPGASNAPVYVNDNGYDVSIPRGVVVTVPNRIVANLNNAVVKRRRQTLVSDAHGREVFRETVVELPSYPFQVIESIPGPKVYSAHELQKMRANGPRRRYKALFGRWPTPRDLARAIEKGLISITPDESVTPEVEKIVEQIDKTDDIIVD